MQNPPLEWGCESKVYAKEVACLSDHADQEKTVPVMDVNAVMEVLPHRYPMLLVDRILELEPGKRAVGIKNVTVNEPFFQGHYPGRPIMPGVLIVEAMAQTAGIAVLTTTDIPVTPLIAGLDGVRFRRPVVPGDQLYIEAVVERMRGRMGKIRAKALVDGETAAEAQLIFALGSE